MAKSIQIEVEKLKIPLSQLNLPQLIIESEDMRLDEVVNLLQRNRMGSLVLGSNDQLSGIITERDFLFRIVGVHDDWQEIPVKEAMTSDPFILDSEQSLASAAQMMSDKKIRHLPVFNKETGKYHMISINDVLKFIASFFSEQLSELGNVIDWDFIFVDALSEDFSTENVDDSMISSSLFYTPLKRVIFNKPTIVDINTSAKDALDQMRSERKNSVIICEHGTTLKGIVTERDFLFKIFGKIDLESRQNKISEFMTPNPHTLLVKHFIGHALNNMFKYRYRNTIVVNEDHYPLSILSIIEIFSYLMSKIRL